MKTTTCDQCLKAIPKEHGGLTIMSHGWPITVAEHHRNGGPEQRMALHFCDGLCLANFVVAAKTVEDSKTMGDNREWLVVGTALCPPCILLQDINSGQSGVVKAYTTEELVRAYSSPSSPYYWNSDYSRVQLTEDSK